MKIDEIMRKFPEGALFKVGFKHGSNFVFIGTREEFLGQLKELDQKEHIACRNAKESALKNLKEPKQMDFQSMETILNTYKATVELATALENVAITDRDVVEHYNSIDSTEEPSHIIMLEGFSNGHLWTVSEAKRNVNKTDVRGIDTKRMWELHQQGMKNVAIASVMGVSESTVGLYLRKMRKEKR